MSQLVEQLAMLDGFLKTASISDWKACSDSMPGEDQESIVSCLAAMHEKGSNYFYIKHLYWNGFNNRWQRRNGEKFLKISKS